MGNNDNQNNKKWLKIIIGIIGIIVGLYLMFSAFNDGRNAGAYNAGYKDGYTSTYKK